MIKTTKTILTTAIRRQDTSWKYEWDVDNPDKPGTIFLNPIIYDKRKSKTWTLAPTEDTGANPNTLALTPEDTDSIPKNRLDGTWYADGVPTTEGVSYPGEINSVSAAGDAQYDRNDPSSKQTARYLSPELSKFLEMTAEVGNVTIDPIPPEFISNENTDYVSLSPTYNNGVIVNDVERHFEYQFKDNIGLDFKQFRIKLKTPRTSIPIPESDYEYDDEDGYLILYDYSRPESADPNYKGTFFPNTKKDRWIKNIKIKYDGKHTYSVSFDLISSKETMSKDTPKSNYRFFTTPFELEKIGYKKSDVVSEIPVIFLNEVPDGITIGKWEELSYKEKFKGNIVVEVWDLAGNVTEYVDNTEFWTIDIDDINNLDKVQIKFYDTEPSTFNISPSVNGSTRCNVQDVVKALWRFPVVAYLMDSSVGQIDMATYEGYTYDETWSHGGYNAYYGQLDFVINNITEYGYIEVEAWVETGNKKIDALIKERTYNTGSLGPWIFEGEGRKYNIRRYVPSYLRQTEFADFIEWFELYINTMYLGLDVKRNISALEKIARINNFNDIDAIENKLLMHYENQYGNEFPFDQDAMQELNNIYTKFGFGVKDEQEVFDTIKYVLANLPSYNKFKGSNIGMAGAIKMFGFSCKVINLWIRKENTIEENPEFIEEDRLHTFAEMFQTSRFNVEIGSNNTFQAFNENLDFFIDLIKSMKPITKILDSIKYTIIGDKQMSFVTTTFDNKTDEDMIKFHLIWKMDDFKDVIKSTAIIDNKMRHCLSLSFPYVVSDSAIRNGKKLSNYYNIIGKVFDCSHSKIIFKCSGTNPLDGVDYELIYKLPVDYTTLALNPGSFAIGSNIGSVKTDLYNMYSRWIDSDYTNVKVEMEIDYIPGTNYAHCTDEFWLLDKSGAARIEQNGEDTVLIVDSDSTDMLGLLNTNIKFNQVEWNRKITPNTLSSIVLPFSCDASDLTNATFYDITKIRTQNNSYIINQNDLTPATTIEANTPYLMISTANHLEFDEGEYNFNNSRTITKTIPILGTSLNMIMTPIFEYTVVGDKYDLNEVDVYGIAGQSSQGYVEGQFVNAAADAYIKCGRVLFIKPKT